MYKVHIFSSQLQGSIFNCVLNVLKFLSSSLASTSPLYGELLGVFCPKLSPNMEGRCITTLFSQGLFQGARREGLPLKFGFPPLGFLTL